MKIEQYVKMMVGRRLSLLLENNPLMAAIIEFVCVEGAILKSSVGPVLLVPINNKLNQKQSQSSFME